MTQKNVKAAKEKVSKAIDQAKDTLKMLESYTALIKLPNPEKLINKKMLRTNLKKLGLATCEDVEALEERLAKMEKAMAAHSEEKHEALQT